MKAYKFLMTTIIVTVVALLYVNQQTALIRLSYDIKTKDKAYSDLLDRSKILLYNVRQLESPARLERILLAKQMKLEVPSRERVILVSAASEESGTKGITRTAGFFGKIRQTTASLFALGPEAQANLVK
ncbi:MAG: hypothetical protein A3F87_04470 [Omnitrophica WOR_2 bacterium RIFCSPLOWO2_12_FULL_51_24]|nr:MAG: hypothetical protein A3I43_04975 [Omnitrophica WOR_2 bacterium RIFCSPLOWO2_02_FULL_50_19]OGX43150.1 MAG: hypothetical protein A3F87_04470 [Omnitrophica WOR_2 bacterium RIFCSPLOWO2_12_FULL_51_24]